MPLAPRFTITNAITAALTEIERARGFLDSLENGGLVRHEGETNKLVYLPVFMP